MPLRARSRKTHRSSSHWSNVSWLAAGSASRGKKFCVWLQGEASKIPQIVSGNVGASTLAPDQRSILRQMGQHHRGHGLRSQRGFELRQPRNKKLLGRVAELVAPGMVPIQLGQTAEDFLRTLPRRLRRSLVVIRPRRLRIGPYEQLKALDQTIVRESIGQRLSQVRAQSRWLNAAEERNAAMLNVYRSAADAIEDKARITIPCLQIESALLLPPIAIQRGQPTGQFIAQNEQAGRIIGELLQSISDLLMKRASPSA